MALDFLKPEIIISLAAITLTIVTLFQTRRHNKLSVTPHLNTFLDQNTPKECLSLYLMNNGIGPAKINNITVVINGKPCIGLSHV